MSADAGGPPSDPYQVLGVAPGADAAEIRRAYLALARRFHPDAHADRSPAERAHAERRMRDVNVAWATLSDPARRRDHDAQRQRAAEAPPARERPTGPGWRPLPDDDAWMDDFESWRHETDLLPPDPPGPRRPVRMLPAAFLAAAVVAALLGMILTSRYLIAAASSLALMSFALWIWLPLVELAQSRRHDPDR